MIELDVSLGPHSVGSLSHDPETNRYNLRYIALPVTSHLVVS